MSAGDEELGSFKVAIDSKELVDSVVDSNLDTAASDTTSHADTPTTTFVTAAAGPSATVPTIDVRGEDLGGSDMGTFEEEFGQSIMDTGAGNIEGFSIGLVSEELGGSTIDVGDEELVGSAIDAGNKEVE